MQYVQYFRKVGNYLSKYKAPFPTIPIGCVHWFAANLPMQGPRLDVRPGQVVFVVNKVSLWQVFQFYPVTTISPTLSALLKTDLKMADLIFISTAIITWNVSSKWHVFWRAWAAKVPYHVTVFAQTLLLNESVVAGLIAGTQTAGRRQFALERNQK